jgi:hypothetical protein
VDLVESGGFGEFGDSDRVSAEFEPVPIDF